MKLAALIDRAIEAVAPRTALRRLQARAQVELLKPYIHRMQRRAYEGAKIDRSTFGWAPAGSGANTEIGPALHRLRNRSRDLTRNNAWANKAIRVITGNTVGPGILPTTKDKKAQELWKEWAESPNCDVDGVNTLYGLQSLALRTVVEAGECLVRRVNVATNGPIPLQIQILEPDHLDTEKTQKLDNGGMIVQGVELNALRQRVAYWMFAEHPGESTSLHQTSIRVPAMDLQHLFRVERAGQIRGVPWPSSCLIRCRDYDEYLDAQLQRQKIAAMFVGFVHDINADPNDDSKTKMDPAEFEPGTWEYLPPGKNITFADPPGVEGLSEYARLNLREVAAGYGVTYEALTGDLSNVNFSSGRLGVLEFQREIGQTQRMILLPRFCNPIWSWFTFAAALAGRLGIESIPVTWTVPRREQIDPKRETDARILRVRSGFASLSEELRQDGVADPDSVIDELSNDMEKARDKNLRLDTDGLAEVVSSPFDVETPGGIE